MPGIRIALTADEANAALNKFRSHLQNTGAQAIKTEKEIKSLEDRMSRVATAQKGMGNFNEMSKMLNLSAKEAGNLKKELGLMDMSKLAEGSSLTENLSGQLGSLAAKFMTITAVAAGAMAAIGGFTSLLKQGIEMNSQYEMSSIKMAAMMVPKMEGDADPGTKYKEAKIYADELLLTLERIDKDTFANANELRMMTEEMMKQGVVLDINNEKQVQAFKAISNAAATVAAGSPNKEIQIRQEVKALMQGQARQSDQLGQMLKSQVKDLEKEVALHKQNGDLIEWLAEQFVGFAAAQGDINASWEATKSSLETIYNQVLRQGFATAFKDIIAYTKEFSAWATTHKQDIQEILVSGWLIIKDVVDAVLQAYQDHKAAIDNLIDAAGTFISIFADFASTILYDVISMLAEIISAMADWNGESENTWESIKGIYNQVMDVAAACIPVIKWLNAWLNPLAMFKGMLEPVAKLLMSIVTLDLAGMKAGLAGIGKTMQQNAAGLAAQTMGLPDAITDSVNKRQNKRAADAAKAEQRAFDKENRQAQNYGFNRTIVTPKVRAGEGKEKKGKSTEGAEFQMAQMVDAWKDKVEQLNPELDKQSKEVMKLEEECNKLLDKLQHLSKTKKIDTSGEQEEVKAYLAKAKGYLLQKYKKQQEKEMRKQSDLEVNLKFENEQKMLKMEQDYQTKLADIKVARGEASEKQLIEMRFAMQKQSMAKELEHLNIKLDQERLNMQEELKSKQELENIVAKLEGREAQVVDWSSQAYKQLQAQIELKKEELAITDKLLAVELELYKNRLRNELGYLDPSYAQQQKDILAQKVKDMNELGLDRNAIAKYRSNQEKKIEIEKNKSIIENSDNMFEVLKAQNNLYALEAKGFAQQFGQAYTDSIDAMKSTTSDFFNDFFNGELKSATDYFKSFTKAINRIFADMIAEMVTKNLIGSLFGSTGTSGNNYTSNASSGGGFLSTIGSMFSGLFGGGGSAGSITPGGGSFGGAGASGSWDMSYNGNVFMNRNIVPFRNGGIVNQLSYFPMANGGIGSMAEQGPEAIMPLARTKSGKLGVASSGGSSSTTTNLSVPITVNGFVSNKGALISELRTEMENTAVKVMQKYS